jgi:dolichyl-phosphate beta-glucosyltransferase
MRSRGEYILMADADGATKAADLIALLNSIQQVSQRGQGIAVGSRAHLQADSDSTVKRSALRKFLMWGFHTLMALVLGGSSVQDTQCGFKLFTRATAARIFPCQHIQRWAFDVELLLLASTWGDVPVVEVPVHWEEIDGSKVDIVWDTLQMARDLVIIKACYMLGLWADREGGSKDKQA